jgi:hypothetical protein
MDQQISVYGLTNTEVLLLGLLAFGIVSFVSARLIVRYRVLRNGPPLPGSEEAYEYLPVAWPTIFIIWPIAAIALGRFQSILPGETAMRFQSEVVADGQKLLFLVYAVGFASMWLVYFMSKSENTLFKVRSLRRLLSLYSVHWNIAIAESRAQETAKGDAESHPLLGQQEKKAASSMASIALLIASAAVVLGLINDTALQSSQTGTLPLWDSVMLGLAAATAIAAFYCFLVAADVLETVFNRFEPEAMHFKIIGNLYRYAINPKYFGLIFLMASVALFAAARQPAFGALALASATFIGYGHWFPRLNPRRGLAKLEWVIRITIVVLPALVVLKVI